MSRLSEIEAAWDELERWLGPLVDVRDPRWIECRERIKGTVAYHVREGWQTVDALTVDGAVVSHSVAVLMEGGRPVGVRRLATDADGKKRYDLRGGVLEDVYGHVGGRLKRFDEVAAFGEAVP